MNKIELVNNLEKLKIAYEMCVEDHKKDLALLGDNDWDNACICVYRLVIAELKQLIEDKRIF